MLQRFLVVIPLLVLLMCKNNGGPGQAVTDVKELRVTNQVPGWSEDTTLYKEFEGQGIFTIIDGYGQMDVDNGLINGIFQRLYSPDSSRLEVLVEDFGAETNARQNFLDKKESLAETASFSDYSPENVLADEYPDGATVIAWFDMFFIYISMNRFDSAAQALVEAEKFVDYYYSGIKPGG
jgi:hypothetical protein